jgi:hypothetical protein
VSRIRTRLATAPCDDGFFDEEYKATPERSVAAVVPELKERRVDNRVNATRPGEPFTFQAMDIGRQHVRRRAAR